MTPAIDRRATARARFAVCKRCPEFKAVSRCARCGCFMPVKVWITEAVCPLGHWPTPTPVKEPAR